MELISRKISDMVMLLVTLLPLLELVFVEAGVHVDKPKYGYQDGEITQGIGYGHHLHPFYYQGKMWKYYNCAIEDEWRPIAVDLQTKIKKASPPKKYNRLETTMKITGPKLRMFKKKVMNRNDRSQDTKTVEREHAKLISEINGMYEKMPLPRYRIMVPETLQTEETILDDMYSPEPTGYQVHEPSIDIPQNHLTNNQVQAFKKVSATNLPFQHYKKFKVVTLKPNSIIKYKYFGVPMGAKINSDSPGHSRPFISNSKIPENKDGGLGVRNGKRLSHQRPHLSMLEQFLLLFPKLI